MRDIIGEMRWGMRDVIGEMRWGMRDGPPPRNRPGRAAVFWSTPPACINHKTGTANYQLDEKRMFIFRLTC